MSDWETSQSSTSNGHAKYAIDQFYTRSRENGGMHATVKTNIPENLQGQIAALVASGKIPDYRTVADVVRDSLVHRMKWVGENFETPELDKAITSVIMLDQVLKLEREQQAEEQLVEVWSRTLAKTSKDQRGNLIAMARENASRMTWNNHRQDLINLLDRME